MRVEINTSLLKNILETLNALIEDANFIFDENGLKITAMDGAHIAMVHLELPKAFFKSYSLIKEEKLGIVISQFHKFMKRATVKDKTILNFDKGNKLKIIFEGKTKRIFSLPLQDIEEEDFKIPKFDHNSITTVSSDIIATLISDAEIISSEIKFIASQDKFMAEATSEKGDLLTEITKENDESLLDSKIKKESKSVYTVEYLSNIIKAKNISKKMILSFSTDMPLEAEFSIIKEEKKEKQENSAPRGKIVFFIAPKVEEEEEFYEDDDEEKESKEKK